jgi:DNA-binding transcriptional regulator YiaG
MQSRSKGFIGHRWLNTNGRASSGTEKAEGINQPAAHSQGQPQGDEAGKRQDSAMARKQSEVLPTRSSTGGPTSGNKRGNPAFNRNPVGMMQKDFAEIMGVSSPTVSRWVCRGFLALEQDGSIKAEESIQKLKERYPEGVKASLSESKRRSYWSNGPHCMTTKALQSWSKMKSISK